MKPCENKHTHSQGPPSLKAAKEVTELQAAVFRTILKPADCNFVTAATNASAALAQEIPCKSGKHSLGKPQSHLCSAVACVAVKTLWEGNRSGPKGFFEPTGTCPYEKF